MKVPLSEQIATAERRCEQFPSDAATAAILQTLKWVEKHQAELRVLGEFPIEAVTVREARE